jgi:hypothetical protein
MDATKVAKKLFESKIEERRKMGKARFEVAGR